MKIRYLGHSCFEITAKNGLKIVTDPYQKVGYELPKGLQADIVTVSHGHFDHAFLDGVKAPIYLTSTARYQRNGVEIYGVSSYHDEKKGALRGENIVFIIKVDGVTLCHMGDIGEPCTPTLIEAIGEVDALFVPVGGTYTVDGCGAKAYADGIAPKTVIPMHYRPKDGSLDIAGINPFLALFEREDIVTAENGEIELNETTTGVIYMQRVKE